MSEHDNDNDDGVMPEGLNVWKPKERLIYTYFDGERHVKADPVVLYKRIMSRAGELDADFKAANFPGFNKAEEAYEGVVKKLCHIFRVKTQDEGGLTPTELEDLLDHFLAYCEWVKKNYPTTLTFATATSAPTASSSAASPPTSNTSASGSTATAPSAAAPSPTPSAPASPPAPSPQAWSIGGTPATEREPPG